MEGIILRTTGIMIIANPIRRRRGITAPIRLRREYSRPAATGTLRLKGTFPNKDGALWPGEFLNVRLLARTAPDVVTVPSSALQRGQNGYYAYVADPTVLSKPGLSRSARSVMASRSSMMAWQPANRSSRPGNTASARCSRRSNQPRREGLTAGARPRRAQKEIKMNISSAFIARPIATSLLMAGILLIGAAAYPLLPVAPLPQVDFPTILVTRSCPAPAPRSSRPRLPSRWSGSSGRSLVLGR